MDSYGRVKAVITKLEKFIETATKEASRSMVKHKMDVLERNYTKFVLEIDGLYESNAITDEKYEDEMRLYTSKFDNVRAALSTMLNDSVSDGSADETDSDGDLRRIIKQQAMLLEKMCGTKKVERSVRLPKIGLKPFSGNYAEWKPFSDMFRSTIQHNEELSSVEKLHYLKSLLRGDAERIVRNVAITEGNFNVAWSLLLERYENDKNILDDIIKRFNRSKRIQNPKVELCDFATGFSEMLRALDSLGEYARSRDPWIISKALSMLDEETVELWAHHSVAIKEPMCNDLLRFLQNRQAEIEIAKCATIAKPLKPRSSQVLTVSKISCYCCNGDHLISSCQKLMSRSVADRVRLLGEHRLCYNCLRRGHMASKCVSKMRCAKCNGRHNTIIHDSQFRDNRVTRSQEVTAGIEQVEASSNVLQMAAQTCNSNQPVLLPTAEVRVECVDGRFIHCRVLMDVGSQVNIISESLIARLGVARRPTRRWLSGIASGNVQESRGVAVISLCSRFDSKKLLDVEALIVKNLIGAMPDRPVDVQDISLLKEYRLADEDFNQPKPIDMLIGVNGYCQLTKPGKNYARKDKLWMLNSELGWLICGGRDGSVESSVANVTVMADVDRQLEKFWKLDGIEEDAKLEEESRQADEVERGIDGRYIVKLPFVNHPPLLGRSLEIARKQFERLEARFGRDKALKQHYEVFMADYERLGHMRRMTPVEQADSKACCYLPHHGIFSKGRIRVVFNAASKTSNGRSLNDELIPGPNIQARLVDIIARVREHRFVFVTDVKMMYRQIRLHRENSTFLRILWRKNPDEPLQHYTLLTVTYGTNCAPYSALRVMNQLAADESEAFPRAARIVRNQRYMDDLFGGDDDLEQAVCIRDELVSMMRNGGFELGKWASNHPELLRSIPYEDCAVEPTAFEDADRSLKTLGVVWYPKQDQYSFLINIEPTIKLTKRGLLSELSRIFDPLGWLAPVVVKAKLLMQQVWQLKIEWDDALPDDLSHEWDRLRGDLSNVLAVRIDRWLGNGTLTELHGFADASRKAYGAVIYCTTIDNAGNRRTSLIAAKSRLAPITEMTMPRLELCAATLLSQLMQHHSKLMSHRKPHIRCYSDSKVVLCWISKQPNELSVFVRNRVQKVWSCCPSVCWSYVYTKFNPADVISRGQYPNELLRNDLWWHGPGPIDPDDGTPTKWLEEDPALSRLVDSETIVRTTACHTVVRDDDYGIERITARFSTLIKLKRAVAWALRWRRLDMPRKNNTMVSNDEMKQAYRRIIKMTQSRAFADEYRKCSKMQPLKPSSQLRKLSPFLDEHGFLRVGGRLNNSDISANEKNPIVIPYGHLAVLIVRDAHLSNLHCGVRQTLFLCRKHYWILNLLRLVKKEIRGCERCARFRAETYQPTMGQLPSFRVSEARAFYRTGVDYAGPFTVRAFRSRGRLSSNGYVAVFVCLVTKAVHFELVSSLDTGSFLAALERFVARRGNCSELWSDNGRNFVGACNYLRTLFERLKHSKVRAEIRDAMAARNVTWNFIPPYSPHFGGLWESAVKIMKTHLKKTILNNVLSFEEFNTILCRIEMIMNSRPLAPMVNDPEDCAVVTPNNFLIGESVGPLDLLEGDQRTSLRQRLRLIQELTVRFWTSWRRDYLRAQLCKSKWVTGKQQPTVGDLVIVRRDALPPGQWKRARIKRLIPGEDGEIRVVETSDGTSNRIEAVRNLIPIPLSDEPSTAGGCSGNR